MLISTQRDHRPNPRGCLKSAITQDVDVCIHGEGPSNGTLDLLDLSGQTWFQLPFLLGLCAGTQGKKEGQNGEGRGSHADGRLQTARMWWPNVTYQSVTEASPPPQRILERKAIWGST